MIYCMIPSRKGSERIPGKVNSILGGKPLITWTIDQALESKYIDDIASFTNDEETKDIVSKYYHKDYIKNMHKPDNVSKDVSTLNDAVNEYIKIRELKSDDIIVVLFCTVPFRSFIDDAIEAFLNNNCKSLQAIKKSCEKPFGGLRRRYIESSKRDVYELVVPEWENIYRTQENPEVYFASGGIYISLVSEVSKLNSQFFNIETYGYIIEDELETLDIDTVYDLNFARANYKEWLNGRKV